MYHLTCRRTAVGSGGSLSKPHETIACIYYIASFYYTTRRAHHSNSKSALHYFYILGPTGEKIAVGATKKAYNYKNIDML